MGELHVSSDTRISLDLIIGRSLFLAIELLLKFGFDHQTRKPGIFGHRTLETVQFWPSGGFAKWFR
jgi:hypothetical protein